MNEVNTVSNSFVNFMIMRYAYTQDVLNYIIKHSLPYRHLEDDNREQ